MLTNNTFAHLLIKSITISSNKVFFNKKNEFYWCRLASRTAIIYSDEIYNYENLIEQYSLSKGFDVYFWSTDNDIIINLSETKLKQKKEYLK